MAKRKRRPKNSPSINLRKTPAPAPSTDGVQWFRAAAIASGLFAIFAVASLIYIFSDAPPEEVPPTEPFGRIEGNLAVFWGALPERVTKDLKPTSLISNIHPGDYIGHEACRECHKENHESWSKHPHRWMNALADAQTVVGDFSGDYEMKYKGGVGNFYQEGDQYRMRYTKGDTVRVYQINQTIGSRFFQYYVGKGLEGPESEEHDYYHRDHVLPFGYWIDRKAWVPIVHVYEEEADDRRWDPIDSLSLPERGVEDEQANEIAAPGQSRGAISNQREGLALQYAQACNPCHTTFPLADMFVRLPSTNGSYIAAPVFMSLSKYLENERPNIWDGSRDVHSMGQEEFSDLIREMIKFEAPDEAAALGITCEACHLGCKTHAEDKQKVPSFAPHSPHLLTHRKHYPLDTGKTHHNVNWVCSRCHNGNRPTYACGAATWNSTEFTDATKGSCYSELTCVQCHDPHKAIGTKWTKTADQDDASCLNCHQQFNDSAARQKHTHHPAGSSGDHCMNCHMPKINEGIQDVVRTHAIFSPTQVDMIEANQPNACNLCHSDEPIDWTLKYLKSWYGKDYSAAKIAKSYPLRNQPVGRGWLKHPEASVRLVAAATLAEANANWALPDLAEMLDDDHMINRQFTQRGLERMLNIKLDEKFGYWFYMTNQERSESVQQIRKKFQNEGTVRK